jgi:phage N-6-adenine-methyltransferase
MADAEFSNEMDIAERARAGRDLEVDVKRALIRERPERVRQEQATADTMIAAAARLGRWDELERAVDIKIAQQHEFVAIWDRTVGRPGGDRQSIVAPVATMLSVSEAQKRYDVDKRQVSRWRTETAPERIDKYRQHIIDAATQAAELKARPNHLAEGTGRNEWYTPQDYVEAARLVLGEIDLGPATCSLAQGWIKAKKFFTEEDDALTKEWHGKIWLNPPYSREKIKPFIDKMVAEIEAKRVTAAVVLTHSYTDPEWFHKIGPLTQAMCFTKGRIAFTAPYGDPCKPVLGSVFFYYGPDVRPFKTVFSAFGGIVEWRRNASS